MKNMYKNLSQITSIWALILFVFFSQNAFSTQYTNDMDYVLGDAKQAFIKNRVTTTAQADNLLKGFKEMGVNGVRIPIFAEGLDPNKPMLDYFYDQAIAQGFLVFANPAQHSGGKRIANGVLDGVGVSVEGDAGKSNVLIERIRDIAEEYPDLTWINPFNEDARPDGTWSTEQMNTIYSSLQHTIGDVELIGPGVWGLPASILVLENTDVGDYISVATTHNLGFNHGRWPEFIRLAEERGLPVWDSEVNHNDKFGSGTRLESALANNVDGLVLYNSWQAINMTNGTINNSARAMMDLFLKSTSDSVVRFRKSNATDFAIDGSSFSGDSVNVFLWSFNANNENQQWEEIDRGDGYYSYQKKGTNFSLDGGKDGANGQTVYLWTTSENNHNQHWRKVDTGDGSFRLEKRNAPGFSIDGGSGAALRQDVYLWESQDRNKNQQWVFE